MNINDLPAPGTAVTVTIRVSDAETHTFHGRLSRVSNYYARPSEFNPHSFTFLPQERGDADDLFGEPFEPFAEIHDLTDNSIDGQALASTRDWYGESYKIFVRVVADAVTIIPITPEGQKWIAERESVDLRKTAFLDHLESADPTLAKIAQNLLWDIENAARREGERAEAYGSHYR